MKPQTILLYFAIIAVLAIAFVAGDGDEVEGDDKGKGKDKDKGDDKKEEKKEEVKIQGRYQLATNPDNEEFGAYLKQMGFSEKHQSELRKNKKIIVTIAKVNKTTTNVKTLTKGKTREMTFQSGKEFQSKLSDDRVVTSIITMNHKEKSAVRVIQMDGFEATNTAIFWKDGMNLTLTAEEATAMLAFKRIRDITDIKTFMDTFVKNFFS